MVNINEEWWLLSATTEPEDIGSWCALVRLDRDRIERARRALVAAKELNVSELRLHEATLYFLPLDVAEAIVENGWEDSPVLLTSAQATQVRLAAERAHKESSSHITDCDEMVLWPHCPGFVHWAAMPKHGDFTITTEGLDLTRAVAV